MGDGLSIYRDGESYLERSSGVQGYQPLESEVQVRRPRPGWARNGGGGGGNYMQIMCQFVLSWVRDPHQMLRGASDPANGKPAAWRAVLWESLT